MLITYFSNLCRYLQWLIEDQDFDDPQLHTLYALSLAKSVIGSIENDATIETRRLSEMNVIDAGEGNIRERLQLFLHGSDLYDAEKVLYVIEETELWLEKVRHSHTQEPFLHCMISGHRLYA